MPRWLRSALIAFVVCFTIAFVLRLLGAGQQSGYIGAIFGMIVFFLSQMFTGNRKQRNLSSGDREEALAAQPPAGFGFVFVVRNSFLGMAVGFDIRLDGTIVAQLKSPRFVRLVVPAGEHTLSAGPAGSFAASMNKAGELRVDVPPGSRLLFEVKNRIGAVQNHAELLPRPPAEIATVLRSITMVDVEPAPAPPPML